MRGGGGRHGNEAGGEGGARGQGGRGRRRRRGRRGGGRRHSVRHVCVRGRGGCRRGGRGGGGGGGCRRGGRAGRQRHARRRAARRAPAVCPPHKKPVVDVAQGVGHEGRRLIVAPGAIDDELVLVVAGGRVGGRKREGGSADVEREFGAVLPRHPHAHVPLRPPISHATQHTHSPSRPWSAHTHALPPPHTQKKHSPWRQVHDDRKLARRPRGRRHRHRLHPARKGAAQVDLEGGGEGRRCGGEAGKGDRWGKAAAHAGKHTGPPTQLTACPSNRHVNRVGTK